MSGEYVEEPMAVRIKDEVATETWDEGKRYVPLRILRIEYARIGKALAEHDARMAKILHMPERERSHAASS